MNVATEHSSYCLAHGGNKAEQTARLQSLNNYRLTRANARLLELAHNPNLKNLRDEVAILRIMLEERLNSCKDAVDMMTQSGALVDLITKIQLLVISAAKLERVAGDLLDRSALINFANEVVTIISEEVTDAAQISRISDRIFEATSRASVTDIAKDPN
jgi:glutamine synthetase adenylyltransferase